MKVNATASITKSTVEDFELKEIRDIFESFDVALKGILFETNIVKLSLTGTKENLRLAVKFLYSHSKNAAKIYLQKYLKTLENHMAYRKHYDQNADKYMRYCALNNLIPHPEVIEDYVF